MAISLKAHYSAHDIEARILAALGEAGLNPEQRLSPEELAALDHFHTGGLRASRELQELAQIRGEDRVLDIGTPGWPILPGCSLLRSAAASTASNCRPITARARYC
jgi:hypothetical protein